MSSNDNRLEVLTESEIDELYSIPNFTEELRADYFTLNDLEKDLIPDSIDPLYKAYRILLLGYLKYKPVVLTLDVDKIKADLDFIRKRDTLHFKLPRTMLDSSQKTRMYSAIFALTGHSFYDEKKHHLCDFISRVSKEITYPKEIFDRCIGYLSDHKIVIPAYSTLQKVIAKGIRLEHDKLQSSLIKTINNDTYKALRAMASSEANKPLITQIKKLPKTFKYTEISHEIKIYEKLQAIFPAIKEAISTIGISKQNIEYFSSLVHVYTITRLRELSKETFALYMTCYLYQRYRQMTDILVHAFKYHTQKIVDESSSEAKKQLFDEIADFSKNFKKTGSLIQTFVSDQFKEDTPFCDVLAHVYSIVPRDKMPAIINYFNDIESSTKKYQWEYYEKHHNKIIKTLRKIFLCLDLYASQDEKDLLLEQALTTKDELIMHGKMSTFDKRLTRGYKPYLIPNESDSDAKINYPRAEMLLYIKTAGKLHGYQFNVMDSQSFQSIDDDFVEASKVPDLVGISNLPLLQMTPNALLKEKMALLNEKIQQASQRLTDSENPSVVFSNKNGTVKWTVKRRPRLNDDRNNKSFFHNLSKTHIGDIIEFCERQTKFSSELVHIKHKQQCPNLNTVIACVVANGTRYGVHHMSALCNIPYDEMIKTEKNFLRVETVGKANDIISNAIAKLSIFKHYNIQEHAVHASYDGQRLESRFNTINTRFSSKYFGRGKGISAVTLNVNHVPIYAKIMEQTGHESHYLFDVLYNNSSEIKPDIISTDTHGTNRVNFALLDLSGWLHAPRYADTGKVLADLFTCTEDGDALSVKLRQPINEQVIIDGWGKIQQILMTLHSKEASQSTIVRKLANRKNKMKSLKGLLEYDRLIKCIYMLDLMNNETFERNITRSLNRVESYHQLQRRIEDVNGGKFRGKSDREIQLWYECSRLLANCVIYFNACIMSSMLDIYEKMNQTEKIEAFKHYSPVAWTHINFNGSYSFSFDGQRINIEDLIQQLVLRDVQQ